MIHISPWNVTSKVAGIFPALLSSIIQIQWRQFLHKKSSELKKPSCEPAAELHWVSQHSYEIQQKTPTNKFNDIFAQLILRWFIIPVEAIQTNSLEMRHIRRVIWIIHLGQWGNRVKITLKFGKQHTVNILQQSITWNIKKTSVRLKISVISRNSWLSSNILLWIRKYYLLLLIIVFCERVLKEKSLFTPIDTEVLFEYSA